MRKFLPYTHQSIDKSDIEAVAAAMRSDQITRGSLVEEFEQSVADYCGAKYAVAFNSGTAALMAAYDAVDLKPYDRVLTTPNTFVSTAGAAIQKNAQPIFVDIDRNSGNLDLEALHLNFYESSSRGRTVIVPVHFAGIAVDMEKIDQMILDPDTVVIEDASHAWGSSYSDGKKVGSCEWSNITIFSLHAGKNITMGEGGVATTNDEELARKMRLFRNNGIADKGVSAPWHYDVVELTGNYNVTDLSAALGLNQLKRLDLFAEKRRELVRAYRKKLSDLSHVRLFSEESDDRSCYHLFVVQIDFAALGKTRAEVMHALSEKGIGTQVHYIPVYRFSCIAENYGDISEYFPEMEAYYQEAISLPLYYDLTKKDVDYVAETLRSILL